MSIHSASLPTTACPVTPRVRHNHNHTKESMLQSSARIPHTNSSTNPPVLQSTALLVSAPVTPRNTVGSSRLQRKALGKDSPSSSQSPAYPSLKHAQSIESGATVEIDNVQKDGILPSPVQSTGLLQTVPSNSAVIPSRLHSHQSPSPPKGSHRPSSTDAYQHHMITSLESTAPSTPKPLPASPLTSLSPAKTTASPASIGSDKKGTMGVPRLLIPPEMPNSSRSSVDGGHRDISGSIDGSDATHPPNSPRTNKSVLTKLKNIFGTQRKNGHQNGAGSESVPKSPRGRRLSASSLFSPRIVNHSPRNSQQETKDVPKGQVPRLDLRKSALKKSDSSISTPTPTVVTQLRLPKTEMHTVHVRDATPSTINQQSQEEPNDSSSTSEESPISTDNKVTLRRRSMSLNAPTGTPQTTIHLTRQARVIERSLSNQEAVTPSDSPSASSLTTTFPRSILQSSSHARSRLQQQDGERRESSSRASSNNAHLKRVRFSNSNLNDVTVLVWEIERVDAPRSDSDESDFSSYSSDDDDDDKEEVYDLKTSQRCHERHGKNNEQTDLNRAVQSLVSTTATGSFECSSAFCEEDYNDYVPYGSPKMEEAVCLNINDFN